MKKKTMSSIISVRIIDRKRKPYTNEEGRLVIPTKWIEVKEINLGSIKVPNEDIIEMKIEPMVEINEQDEGDLFY